MFHSQWLAWPAEIHFQAGSHQVSAAPFLFAGRTRQQLSGFDGQQDGSASA